MGRAMAWVWCGLALLVGRVASSACGSRRGTLHLQEAVVQKLYKILELINRVFKTPFPDRHHMEKMSYQT